MDIVKYAFAFSDIEVLKAYIDCFDPGMWLSWSTRTADSIRSENMKEVANLLEKFDVHWRLNKVYRNLHQEYMEIRNWLFRKKKIEEELQLVEEELLKKKLEMNYF